MFYVMAIYDRKAKSYNPPFAVRSFVEATRGFAQLLKTSPPPGQVNNPADYPADFELVHVVSIDEVTGKVVPTEDLPHSLGLALDFIGGSHDR